MMNSFEQIGAAQLQAYEGQRLIAHAMARAIGRALVRVLNAIGRHLPETKMAPW
jgi:hypothetical protein